MWQKNPGFPAIPPASHPHIYEMGFPVPLTRQEDAIASLPWIEAIADAAQKKGMLSHRMSHHNFE